MAKKTTKILGKKPKTQTINVLISSGYVEDSSNGWLWWNFTTDLTDPKAIRQKLGDIMVDYAVKFCAIGAIDRACYHKVHDYEACACDRSVPLDTKFCPDCGTKMATNRSTEIDLECAADMIREFNSVNCVDVDQEWVYHMEQNGVKLWGHPINGLMIQLRSFDGWLEKRWGDRDCSEIRTFKNVKFE